MKSNISREQREQYLEEGYTVLDEVIPESLLTMLREECHYFLGYTEGTMDARNQTSQEITHRGNRYFIGNQYRLSDRMWRFLYGDLMAEVAGATLGPEAYLFNEQWVVKCAEQGMRFAWHQDSGYVKYGWRETPHRPYLSCWCPLDDISETNGMLFLLPHSRAGTRTRVLDHVKEEGSNDLVGYTGDEPGVPITCRAGSIVAFTSFSLHRSGPNTSPNPRRTYLAQYSAEPIRNPHGGLWSQAVPFLAGGKPVYDRAGDTAERWGPIPWR